MKRIGFAFGLACGLLSEASRDFNLAGKVILFPIAMLWFAFSFLMGFLVKMDSHDKAETDTLVQRWRKDHPTFCRGIDWPIPPPSELKKYYRKKDKGKA